MDKFNVPSLTDKTPQAQKDALLQALHGVSGVERATLNIKSHQVEIKPKAMKRPAKGDITKACSNAGFKVTE